MKPEGALPIMTALTASDSPDMGIPTSSNTPVKQPALKTTSAGKKHKISPGVSLVSGGIAGGVEAAITVSSYIYTTLGNRY